MALLIALGVIVLLAILITMGSIRIIPQATAGIVERLGKYHKTLEPGLNLIVPGIDRVRPLVDLREKVVSFPPQPVITEDNLVVSIDTVIYFQVTNPKSATYEIENYIQGIEQLVVTTLRNSVGGLDLEKRSLLGITSMRYCVAYLMKRQVSGESELIAWKSRQLSRRQACRSQWKSRCARTAISVQLF